MAQSNFWPTLIRRITDAGITREALCEYADLKPESLAFIEKRLATPGETAGHALRSIDARLTRARFRGKIQPQLVTSVRKTAVVPAPPPIAERGVFEVRPLPEGFKGWNVIDNGELLVEIRVHKRALNRDVPRGLMRWLEEVAPRLRVIHGGASSPDTLPAARPPLEEA